jgi:hypothetical protein
MGFMLKTTLKTSREEIKQAGLSSSTEHISDCGFAVSETVFLYRIGRVRGGFFVQDWPCQRRFFCTGLAVSEAVFLYRIAYLFCRPISFGPVSCSQPRKGSQPTPRGRGFNCKTVFYRNHVSFLTW